MVSVASLDRIKRHIPNLDLQDVSHDDHLEDYWKDVKHYYDNKRAIFDDSVPLADYPEDVIDLFERGAAAWHIYWQSPSHPTSGIKLIYESIVDSLNAEFQKKHKNLSGRTATPKTSSRVTGFT